ncbi:tetratricopeptide repeat protein [Breoghania sp.]|uniref:tetratricopeptide repeat protein n=1 Tax=Breoghania sp. TaxID=2065378 RepID=UPI0026022358|nr:tetratricopeptide repeat protein [Breoghania sp.]MDJ0931043.1 tetratricopeptide repeat protein [Breoghania sp.]
MKIVPGEPSVLNNLAMSHVLENDLTSAEKILRSAMASSTKDTRIRQNLALVLSLQGRFAEAEQVASTDLPPEQVKANMAYLKRMLARSGKNRAS